MAKNPDLPKFVPALVESPQITVGRSDVPTPNSSLRREAKRAALKDYYAQRLEDHDIFASIKCPSDQPKGLTQTQKYYVAMTARGHTAREIAHLCRRTVHNVAQKISDMPHFDYWVDQFRLVSGIFNYNSEFQKAMPDAIRVIKDIMAAGEKDQTRLEAALRIVDRVMGRPQERVEHSGNLLRDVISRLDNSDVSEPAKPDDPSEDDTPSVH